MDSVVDLQNLQITNTIPLTLDVPYDATLFCNQKQNCATVVLSGNSNICHIKDTLVYYLANNNCGAVATWQFDTSFFKFISSSTDSLKLLPSKTGTSFIRANITDACSEKIDSMLVSILVSASSLNLGKDTSICPGSSLTLKAGPGYKSYSWNTSATDSVITVSLPGIYIVTVTDNCGSMATDSITVSEVQNTFHISGDSIKCNMDSVVLYASPGFNKYQWSPQANLISTGKIAKAAPLQTTLYYVEAEKFIGCTVKDSFLVTVKTSPSIHLGNDTGFCIGQSVTLDAGAGFNSYVWSTGAISRQISVSEKGIYAVTATASNSCTSSDTFQITNIIPLPVFSLGDDTTLCTNTTYTYNFNLPNAGYLWSDGNTGNSYTISQPGIYSLAVTQQGCTARDSVVINYKINPQANLGNDTTICVGNSLLLNAAFNNASYLWQDGSTQPDFLVNNTGTYYVTVNLDGCTARDTIQITYLDKPTFTLGNDTVICQGQNIVLHPQPNVTANYLWQDGSTQSEFVVKDTGQYSLQAINICGSYSDAILITSGLCNLMLPNTFTPNHDGLNDIFKVKYLFPAKTFLLSVYNRFGEKVFETTDMAKGWDGTYKALEQPEGVYVWVVQLQDVHNIKQTAEGIITLLR